MCTMLHQSELLADCVALSSSLSTHSELVWPMCLLKQAHRRLHPCFKGLLALVLLLGFYG
jgi:hypothetical protein